MTSMPLAPAAMVADATSYACTAMVGWVMVNAGPPGIDA